MIEENVFFFMKYNQMLFSKSSITSMSLTNCQTNENLDNLRRDDRATCLLQRTPENRFWRESDQWPDTRRWPCCRQHDFIKKIFVLHRRLSKSDPSPVTVILLKFYEDDFSPYFPPSLLFRCIV